MKTQISHRKTARLTTGIASLILLGLASPPSLAGNDFGAKLIHTNMAEFNAMMNAHQGNDPVTYHVQLDTNDMGAFVKAMNNRHSATAQQRDIVDTAIAAGSFNTLVTAVKEANLVDTLKGKGPFTVFAPTDEAFAKVPKETLRKLLADKAALTKVLTYHVVPGKVMAKDVVALSSAPTVQGQSIRIDTMNGVKVDNANVITTDIETSNGVIHVIDTVILPQ